jgi:PncC family amidohydrolase
VKRDLLGVPAAALADHGAVSGPVAEAMAGGCRARLGCDWALSVTGVAGPDGGTAEKPVGTTWIGVDGPTGTWSRRYRFPGNRSRNRALAVACALDTLRRLLADAPLASPWLPADTWGWDA